MLPNDQRTRPSAPVKQSEEEEAPAGPFRIGELSRRSAVPVGTIKYYLREGLLPPGRATAKTQALYDGSHLRRLRLIRVLADVGSLSIAQLRRVTAILDEGGDQPGELAQFVSYAIGTTSRSAPPVVIAEEPSAEERALAEARRASDDFVESLGLQVDPEAPARAELAEVLVALRALGIADDPVVFSEHARLARELGRFEIDTVDAAPDRATAIEVITVGSVLFGAAFMALRRMAHEHETRIRLESGAPSA